MKDREGKPEEQVQTWSRSRRCRQVVQIPRKVVCFALPRVATLAAATAAAANLKVATWSILRLASFQVTRTQTLDHQIACTNSIKERNHYQSLLCVCVFIYTHTNTADIFNITCLLCGY